MAEAVLTDDRRGGDRWAIGMMLILAGLGAPLDGPHRERHRAAARGPRAVRRDPGRLRPLAVVRRARAGPSCWPGEVDEGLEMVASMGRSDGTPLSEREYIVSIMAGLAATVQVGDLARSERMLTVIPAGPVDGEDGELIVGDTERTASVGLHRLQSGDVAGAVDGAQLAGEEAAARDRPQPAVGPRAGARRRGVDRRGDRARPSRSMPTIGRATSTSSRPGSRGGWPCHGGAMWPHRRPPSIRCERPPTPPRTSVSQTLGAAGGRHGRHRAR